MAKKKTQNRLSIPIDIWNFSHFSEYVDKYFAFFIDTNSKIVIANIDLGIKLEYEFIGKCQIDEKHRFIVPKNVDVFLGNGTNYYFSASTLTNLIYLYKKDDVDYTLAKNLFISIRNILTKLESESDD